MSQPSGSTEGGPSEDKVQEAVGCLSLSEAFEAATPLGRQGGRQGSPRFPRVGAQASLGKAVLRRRLGSRGGADLWAWVWEPREQS